VLSIAMLARTRFRFVLVPSGLEPLGIPSPIRRPG
jgi:hypothetical protein